MNGARGGAGHFKSIDRITPVVSALPIFAQNKIYRMAIITNKFLYLFNIFFDASLYWRRCAFIAFKAFAN